MTVTQNAVKREGPQHRLVVLSCWFVSQQRSVGSLRLKVVSHCGETRALWQATPTQHAELQKWHVRETFWICNEVPALTTAFNNIKKKEKEIENTALAVGSEICCQQYSGLQEKGHETNREAMSNTAQKTWVLCPCVVPAKLSNEQWTHMGGRPWEA